MRDDPAPDDLIAAVNNLVLGERIDHATFALSWALREILNAAISEHGLSKPDAAMLREHCIAIVRGDSSLKPRQP